jgi:hypothetical protein
MSADKLQPDGVQVRTGFRCVSELRLKEADVGLEALKLQFLHFAKGGEEQIEALGIEIPGIGLATGSKAGGIRGTANSHGSGGSHGGRQESSAAEGSHHKEVPVLNEALLSEFMIY